MMDGGYSMCDLGLREGIIRTLALGELASLKSL
jgi:hypothetical protein